MQLSLSPALAAGLLALGLLPGRAAAQQAPAAPPPAFYTTYGYTAYTVYDFTTDEPPTKVAGVGGTLALHADGTYDKRLSLLLGDSGPRYFTQHGRFTTAHDSIAFNFTDLKGHDVQRGTFRYEAATQQLTITIDGYPTGNKGVYELAAVPPAPAAAPPPKPRKRAR